ncbi:hypothetical protein ES705_47947 [subsurface metagenome]
MKAIKTITVRLPGLTWERLQELAEALEELPSETARNILKEFLANLDIAKPDRKSGKTGELPGTSRLRERIARNRPATMADLEKLRTGG